MSFGGPAASTSGWCTRPGERGIGSTGCAGRHQNSLLTGLYAMATAEHREPCDSRGSCTVLGAPGGETPSGDSSMMPKQCCLGLVRFSTDRSKRRTRGPLEGGMAGDYAHAPPADTAFQVR